MKNFGTTRTARAVGIALTVLLVGSLAGSGCSSGVEVSFNLVNPCASDVLFGEGCQYIQVQVSSLDPEDPLHCKNSTPASKICGLNEGKCTISGDDLVGLARMIDVLCYVDRAGPPVARASSRAMPIDSGAGGSYNLLIGNINGFVETTIMEAAALGSCSLMAEDGGRYGHASVLLADGRVLITGGVRRLGMAEDILATAEIFDPTTGLHQMVTGPDGLPLKMLASSGRAYHTATLLRDGNVLLAGGVGLVEGKKSTLQSAEIFNPRDDNFGMASVMGTGRAHHAATELDTGEVLITGGASYSNGVLNSYYNTAVLYGPANNSFSQVGNSMSIARAFHQAVKLGANAGGKVLVIGGEDADGPLNSADIYQPPPQGVFMENVNVTMKKNRSHHCAVLLSNGEVLVAGGKTTVNDSDVDSVVEIYNTQAGGQHGGFKEQTFSLNVARMDHTCTSLQTGNVLIGGGLAGAGQATGAGELIMVGEATFSVQQLTDSIDPPRYLHSATMLRSGWVLLAGGLPSQAPEVQAVTQSVMFVPEPACGE